MYFLDESKKRLIRKCPSCNANFAEKKGASCTLTCSAKKLEIEHKKALNKIIAHLFSKKKIKVECPSHLPAQVIEEEGWGWADDINEIIYLPWWTLRSKKEFFDTVSHELAHLSAYWEKFSLAERNVLKKFSSLREECQLLPIWFNEAKLDEYYDQYPGIINRYLIREEHDYNPWYQEYLKLFQKLINSPFIKYAYGNKKPRSHGFDKQGKGKYRPKGCFNFLIKELTSFSTNS